MRPDQPHTALGQRAADRVTGEASAGIEAVQPPAGTLTSASDHTRFPARNGPPHTEIRD
ncbi:MAG TPA: hypothetical protein VIS29_15115 [Streptomyces sp.]